MDDELRAFIREALDLYKRELDIAEASRDRQIAILEANSRRTRSWRWWLQWLVLAAMVAVIMAIGFPLVDWLLNRRQ
jgi:hypothetical protein